MSVWKRNCKTRNYCRSWASLENQLRNATFFFWWAYVYPICDLFVWSHTVLDFSEKYFHHLMLLSMHTQFRNMSLWSDYNVCWHFLSVVICHHTRWHTCFYCFTRGIVRKLVIKWSWSPSIISYQGWWPIMTTLISEPTASYWEVTMTDCSHGFLWTHDVDVVMSYRNWYQYWDHCCLINDLRSSPQPEGQARGLWWASQVVN